MPQTPFEMDSTNDGAKGRVTLTGELDIATVPRVQQAVDAMLAEGVTQITIDLAGVGFVDSSGLRLFIVLDQRATSETSRISDCSSEPSTPSCSQRSAIA